ncbi:hypothetical protein K3495_g14666 [Podosphaera aphanis]|nr:hypothetical protein K3495_g14666 [Podosphaera aphanis]
MRGNDAELVGQPSSAGSSRRRDASLPKWNGISQDFVFYIERLEIQVEVDYAPFLDERTICLDLIETLPETSKPRVAPWFNKRKVDGRFSWRNLIDHFKDTFADRQAQQSASELVNRMEQGNNQYFGDFVLDFEYRVSQCGEEAFTPLGKTLTLKAALNNRFRTALVGVKLPSPKDYDDWVDAVKEVALDLEALANYRPKGASQTGTKLGAPKSGLGQASIGHTPRDRPAVDAEGDVVMGGTNAILAALQKVAQRVEKIEAQSVKARTPDDGSELPRAPWRPQDELKRLIKSGVCLRCTQGGHRAKHCPNFRRARPPKGSLNALVGATKIHDDQNSENESP